MEKMKVYFLNLLNEIPIFEGIILVILTIITVFRKELSSNRDYRKNKSSNSIKWKPMTNMTENIMTKLNSLSDLPFTISTSTSNPEIIETKNNNFLQLLPRDLLIFLLNYLTNIDICRLSCVDKRLASLLHSDFVWEQIWNQRYEGLWRHKIIRSILNRRNIGWNPFNNWGAPSQGWKLFVFEFEYGWLDWILAGSNCSTLCLLGLNGGVYNITPFVYEHPGSPETLLDHSGRDGTITFNEIGHSILAFSLKDSYLIYQPEYVGNLFKCIIFDMKKKYLQEFHNNPIQALKSHNSTILTPFNTRRTISIDIDDYEQKLIVLPQTYFEQKLNLEKEFIHHLAETHYREINYHQEIQLFKFDCDDELQSQLQRSTTTTPTSTTTTATTSTNGKHVPCHENAKNNQQHAHVGITNLFWSISYPKHPGCPREFYDPLSQEWWIWWSCCGCGRSVPRELMK